VLPQVDALLRRIVAAPTPARAEAVQEVVLLHSNRIEARAQAFRVSLYLAALLLLGYLLYQFGRLRSSARALRRANLELEREMAERQQAAAALRTSEERFRAITESANDAIVSAGLGIGDPLLPLRGTVSTEAGQPRSSSATRCCEASGHWQERDHRWRAGRPRWDEARPAGRSPWERSRRGPPPRGCGTVVAVTVLRGLPVPRLFIFDTAVLSTGRPSIIT
jgi:PAS domain-containing protein